MLSFFLAACSENCQVILICLRSLTKNQNGPESTLPSIEVAARLADTLEVSLDYLAGNFKKVAVDKKTLKLIHDIEDLEPSIKDKLIFLANAVIRDAKTGKAYAH